MYTTEQLAPRRHLDFLSSTSILQVPISPSTGSESGTHSPISKYLGGTRVWRRGCAAYFVVGATAELVDLRKYVETANLNALQAQLVTDSGKSRSWGKVDHGRHQQRAQAGDR